MDTGSSAHDGLFDESPVERVELPTDVPMDANGGARKRFKAVPANWTRRSAGSPAVVREGKATPEQLGSAPSH